MKILESSSLQVHTSNSKVRTCSAKMQNLQIIFTWHSYGIDMKNLVQAKTCPGQVDNFYELQVPLLDHLQVGLLWYDRT